MSERNDILKKGAGRKPGLLSILKIGLYNESFGEYVIFRSTQFYPTHQDSEIISKGKENRYKDSEVIPGIRYYYTVYAKENSKSVNSSQSMPGK